MWSTAIHHIAVIPAVILMKVAPNIFGIIQGFVNYFSWTVWCEIAHYIRKARLVKMVPSLDWSLSRAVPSVIILIKRRSRRYLSLLAPQAGDCR